MGLYQSWSTGADCKSAGFGLRVFESLQPHKMKVWRKNRTQCALDFIINGKATIAFLVGDTGSGTLHIETIGGEFKSIIKGVEGAVEKEKEECETETHGRMTWKKFTRKNGTSYELLMNNGL